MPSDLSATADPHSWVDVLPDTEAGRLFKSVNWTATPLGAVEDWPLSLRTAVGICMNSRFPMFVWWGPALINIYNDAHIPMLGKRHPEAYGKRANDTWADVWPVIAPQVDEVMVHGRATWNNQTELELERNGYPEKAFFTWSYSPVYDETGSVGGLFCAVMEETPRIAAERERDSLLLSYRDAASTLRAWFDHAPGFVALLRGPNFVFELVNDAVYRLVGRRELEGRPLFDAMPELRDQGFRELLEAVYINGEPFIARAMPARLQKEVDAPAIEVFVDFTYQPVLGSDGRIVGIFVQGHEVTEQVAAIKALKEADKRKDEFLATLAHELRNPMGPIRTAAQLARRPDISVDKQAWALEVIERQSRTIALLLDDLLDIARISQGRLELRRETVSLGKVIDAAIETARPLLDVKKHRLTVDIPSILLTADPLRLAQVLSNLLSNSAKYTDEGGEIGVLASVDSSNVTIRVRDNGIGILPEAQATIFQMFSQLTSALDRSNGGLGIGLALSRGLVELHGGSIDVHSEGPGLGSEFAVRLPLAVGPMDPDLGVDRSPARVTGRRRKILLADDNPDAIDAMAALLKIEGHDIHTAASGTAALNAAATLIPDVAVLDIGMPGMNGYEVATAIRASTWGASMTLIALTGWGQAQDHTRAKEAGFNHHCTKPVDPEHLQQLIEA